MLHAAVSSVLQCRLCLLKLYNWIKIPRNPKVSGILQWNYSFCSARRFSQIDYRDLSDFSIVSYFLHHIAYDCIIYKAHYTNRTVRKFHSLKFIFIYRNSHVHPQIADRGNDLPEAGAGETHATQPISTNAAATEHLVSDASILLAFRWLWRRRWLCTQKPVISKTEQLARRWRQSPTQIAIK